MGCVWAYKRRLHRRCNHLPFLSSWWTKCLETKDLEAQKVVVPWLFLKSNCWHHLDGGFKYFLCSPLFGEDSHFDSYFSDGLVQPPTSHAMPPTNRAWRFAATPRDVFPRLATNRVGVSWHSELGGEKPWEYLGDIERNTVKQWYFWQMYLGDSSFFKRIFHVSFLGVYVSQLVDGCLKSRCFLQKDFCSFHPQRKHTIGMQHIDTLFECVYFCHLLTCCDWNEMNIVPHFTQHDSWERNTQIFVAWIFSWGAKRIASYAWQIMMIPARPEF